MKFLPCHTKKNLKNSNKLILKLKPLEISPKIPKFHFQKKKYPGKDERRVGTHIDPSTPTPA
jgi:hypothetical protein